MNKTGEEVGCLLFSNMRDIDNYFRKKVLRLISYIRCIACIYLVNFGCFFFLYIYISAI